jgi:hypothetical protein
MFTGIVQTVGRIVLASPRGDGMRIVAARSLPIFSMKGVTLWV